VRRDERGRVACSTFLEGGFAKRTSGQAKKSGFGEIWNEGKEKVGIESGTMRDVQ